MPDNKPPVELTELEKHRAGEPFDSAKMYSEMDDAFWDATMEGFREDPNAPKPTPPTTPEADAN